MSARTSTPPPVEYLGHRVPPLGLRIIVSGLYLVPLVVGLVGLPLAALGFLEAHSVALPVSVLTVSVFGFAIAILSAVRYVVKPSRWYGPMSIVVALVVLLYLFVLLFQATYQFAVPNVTLTVAITYSRVVELLMVVPAFLIAAGIVTTVEDVSGLPTRLAFDFPP